MTVDVPTGVTVPRYFEDIYPRIFAARVPTPPDGMAGRTLRLTFDITGDGGAVYGVQSVDGARVEVQRGGYSPSDIRVTVDVASWRSLIDGTLPIPDPLIIYNTPDRNTKVKETHGAFTIEVTLPDGRIVTSRTRYGDATDPAVTLRAKAADYTALLDGTLNPQLAFLLRKVKISGSLQFLIALNALQS